MPTIEQAFSQYIGREKYKIITGYQMGVFIFTLSQNSNYTWKDQPIHGFNEPLDSNQCQEIVNHLLDIGWIKIHPSFPNQSVFTIMGQEPSVEEIACLIDPFCYVSHLSAMYYHGLTNRIPQRIFITSPRPKKWGEFARGKMENDLGELYDEYKRNGFPLLKLIRIDKIDKQPVNLYQSLHLGAFKIQNNIRVAKIGRTFLDMLRKPDLCGGIDHVLEVYQERADKYLRLIAEEINRNGNEIEKVRAGYIFTERCGLDHPLIHEWEHCAKRGGSRKLDPSAEYSSEYSERWCLSINI